jgi:hypothetical protein
MFFGGFPETKTILFIQLLILLSLVLITKDKLTVAFGLVCFSAMIVLFNIRYSLGKIDHSILLPATLLCFSLGNWKINGKKFLPIPPESLLALFIGFGMFTAGYQKALNWVDFDVEHSGFLSWFYGGYYNLDRNTFLTSYVFKIPGLVIELFDYLVVAFELSALPIILYGKKRYWRIWIWIACLFHLTNVLLLNIPFLPNVLAYLPFILPRLSLTTKKWERILKVIVIVLVIAQSTMLIFFNEFLIGLLNISEVHLALFLWVIVTSIATYSVFFEPSIKKQFITS